MKTLDPANEMAWGYNVGAGIGDSISDALQMPEIAAPGYNAEDIADNTANTADNTGKGAKDAKEQLTLWIVRLTTLLFSGKQLNGKRSINIRQLLFIST